MEGRMSSVEDPKTIGFFPRYHTAHAPNAAFAANKLLINT
jgi:hypothetical protein